MFIHPRFLWVEPSVSNFRHNTIKTVPQAFLRGWLFCFEAFLNLNGDGRQRLQKKTARDAFLANFFGVLPIGIPASNIRRMVSRILWAG